MKITTERVETAGTVALGFILFLMMMVSLFFRP